MAPITKKKKKYELGIVIPAYKSRFLRQALESIAQQTDNRFRVYVGDDASPDDLKKICDDFADRLDLLYTRFSENLGQNSLVAHWNRCIRRSSEPWVWLFCDDDLMEPKCAEMFYKTIDRAKDTLRVLRFNTLTIDDDDEVIRINPPHPLLESGAQFIYHRLRGERQSFVSEYIFSRKSYIDNNGMIEFPIAWCSDDASWLAFSDGKDITTIQDALVYWRRGVYNITPAGTKHQTPRIEAAFEFVDWLDEFFEARGTGNQYLSGDAIGKLSRVWFLRQLKGVAPIKFSNYSKFSRYIQLVTNKSLFLCWATILGYDCRSYFKSMTHLMR
jgi:glycosyltransferase involved in cell wall biosynthesis